MGLRDRYIAAMQARCVVADREACDTQHEVELLHVSPPRETQHATTRTNDATVRATATQRDRALPGVAAQSDATSAATPTQQRFLGRATEEMARLQAWTEGEIRLFQQRQTRIMWLGYGSAEQWPEKLLRRDRDIDDRRLCVECVHARPGSRCAKSEAFLLDQLQRCPRFEEITL
jgi:hypothetical protein